MVKRDLTGSGSSVLGKFAAGRNGSQPLGLPNLCVVPKILDYGQQQAPEISIGALALRKPRKPIFPPQAMARCHLQWPLWLCPVSPVSGVRDDALQDLPGCRGSTAHGLGPSRRGQSRLSWLQDRPQSGSCRKSSEETVSR